MQQFAKKGLITERMFVVINDSVLLFEKKFYKCCSGNNT